MRFFNKRGQSATEYMLVLGLMVALIFIVYGVFKEKFKGVVEKAMSVVTEGITKVSGGGGGGSTPN
ncbi:MAG: hypothetical protein NTY22_07640 [Proteobacteria bacterium]|nr:hypothetical protein [Pseudomonadota bacterium]